MAPPNVKIKHLTRTPSGSGDTRFPKLDECAHFHYENVELGPIKVLLCDKQQIDSSKTSLISSSNKENEIDRLCFLVTVVSNGRTWVVRRSYKNFMFLDTQLHRCVYDRKYSLLCELPKLQQEDTEDEDFEKKIKTLLSEYLERFSQLAGSLINCGPVLNWFELDNRGNRLIVTDEVAINTPAVAAAYVIVPYSALATDEISFDVGDMISVIDMPPPEESSWWRGKKGFEVGFFPSECVEVIGDKVPNSFKLSNSSTKPVFRKHGKLIAFFRSFLLSRPSRRRLKQSGILKERVFGCDLGEHLLNTGREIPLVLKCCAEFIEEYGVVDGIYRLSGVSSNIQRLRLAFDEDRAINLGDPATVHDIHSVASLLKMYFRELPNPLLTYQLYDKFVSAVQSSEEVRLLRIRDIVQQLPPPHFRTLQYLLSHLARVASHGEQTGMTPKNIAIVWAPNLLRSRDVENGGVDALHVVGVQAVLTEYLIRFCDLIFDEKIPLLPSNADQGEGGNQRSRPKSLAISTPTKLLSLEEARARALSTHLPLTQQKYIEVGGGPDKLPSKYHTIIELPSGKQGLPKLKKSPSGWKSFFSRGWYSGSTRDKSRSAIRTPRKASTGSLPHASFMQDKPPAERDAPFRYRKKLRTVKSAESLIHCIRESPQGTNKDDLSGDSSKKSSPQVSVDSYNSSEITSPTPKSPGLQKHTRSSSHESYFENNSMDIISEPSFEDDEHGLYYYVSEQMRMLQDSNSSPWTLLKDENEHVPTCFKTASFYDNINNELEMDAVSSENGNDVEKSARKQKLNTPDDFAQAKFQKLNESETKSDSQISPKSDEMHISPDISSCSHRQNSTVQSPGLESYFWQLHSDDFASEEFAASDNKEFSLDPVSLYDAVVNRNSCISSSDETESGSRTIVERYGNAETVLVEVHATQDSSSEEEHYISKPNEEMLEEIISYVHPDKVDAESPESVPDSEKIKIQEIHRPKSESPSQSDHTDSSSSSSSSSSSRSSCIDDELEQNIFVDGKLIYIKNSPECLHNPALSIQQKINILDERESSNVNKEPTKLSPPITQKVESKDKCINSGFKSLTSRKNDLNLKLEVAQKELEDEDSCHSCTISPPSPVYPPKALKSQDFHSVWTKMETIPVHKKKQLFNVTTPTSPVEEVRKKFELQASSSRNQESPIEHKTRLSNKDPVLKQKSGDVTELVFSAERKPDKKSPETPSPKHHSEISKETKNVFPLKEPSEPVTKPPVKEERRPLTECPSVKPNAKPKSLQPSLFTQMKIRKLQSLKGDKSLPSPESIDPWSDPILDMQEEYHPMVSYIPSEFSVEPESKTEESSIVDEPSKGNLDSPKEEHSIDLDESTDEPKARVEEDSSTPTAEATADDGNACVEVEDQQHVNKTIESAPENEAEKRERINRIKEERRAQLREKLKTESFRLEAEEKEKVQTKFRFRKDCTRFSTPASESQDDNCKEVTKSDKAVETDSANITETGINCDLSDSLALLAENKPGNKYADRKSTTDIGLSLAKDVLKPVSSEESIVHRNKHGSVKKSARSYEDSRKWLSMPPTDIKDKVALFERSKDPKELCRLGPSGKFPQKQSASALTSSSFVR